MMIASKQVLVILLMLLSSSVGGTAALLVSGARASRVKLPAAFHRYPSSSASRLHSRSSNDNHNASMSSSSDESTLQEAIERLVTLIGSSDGDDNLVKPPPDPNAKHHHYPSIVHIIGTGLTPNLLSLPLSTLLLLSKADAVLYDSLGLSYEDICKVVPKHCEVICVGKRGDSQKSWKQSEIDELILQMASDSSTTPSSITQQSSKTILRLKGGDPFLFGRARTEIETLKSNNIPYTYTPSISSCIAGPHLGGIPLTDPMLNCQSFGVWSGTDAFGRSRGLNNEDGEKWEGLGVDTLVFLMIGRLDKLEALCNLLANSGGKWEENTPCAVIQNAGGRRSMQESSDGEKTQRVWRGTLGSIVPLIREEDKTRTSVSPAVFIVGATCQLDFLSY